MLQNLFQFNTSKWPSCLVISENVIECSVVHYSFISLIFEMNKLVNKHHMNTDPYTAIVSLDHPAFFKFYPTDIH